MTIIKIVVTVWVTVFAVATYTAVWWVYWRPMGIIQRRLQATAAWQAEQERAAARARDEILKAQHQKDMKDKSLDNMKKLIQAYTDMGYFYRYKSHETRHKKRAQIQRMAVDTELVGLDFWMYRLKIPYDIMPTKILDEETMENLRIHLGQPDISVIRTDYDGLFLFWPATGARYGIPNQFPWRSGQGRSAMSMIPSHRPYAVPIGLATNRRIAFWDPADESQSPHLLIAGTTGGGKSNMVNQIINAWLTKCTPEQIQFGFVDLKIVELSSYEKLSHYLWHDVINYAEGVGEILTAAMSEIKSRMKLFSQYEQRNIKSWNEKFPNRALPRIVLVIDELALVIQLGKKKVEEQISQITALGRAAGFHVVAATQRPSVDVVTGTIKTNMPTRIALSTDEMGSRTILNNGMAAGLQPRGRAIFMEGGEYHSVQTPLITDHQIAATIADALARRPRRVAGEKLIRLIYEQGCNNWPALLQAAQRTARGMTLGDVGNALHPYMFNVREGGPLHIFDEKPYALWGTSLLPVNPDKLPKTRAQLDQLEVSSHGIYN